MKSFMISMLLIVCSFFSPISSAEVFSVDLSFVPHIVEQTQDGILYMLEYDGEEIARYSLSGKMFLESIQLSEPARSLAISSDKNKLYLLYKGGKVSLFDLSISPIQENEFANVEPNPYGIEVSDHFVFVSEQGSGNRSSAYWNLFSFDGGLVAKHVANMSFDLNHRPFYLWNSKTQTVIEHGDTSSPELFNLNQFDNEGGLRQETVMDSGLTTMRFAGIDNGAGMFFVDQNGTIIDLRTKKQSGSTGKMIVKMVTVNGQLVTSSG